MYVQKVLGTVTRAIKTGVLDSGAGRKDLLMGCFGILGHGRSEQLDTASSVFSEEIQRLEGKRNLSCKD